MVDGCFYKDPKITSSFYAEIGKFRIGAQTINQLSIVTVGQSALRMPFVYIARDASKDFAYPNVLDMDIHTLHELRCSYRKVHKAQ